MIYETINSERWLSLKDFPNEIWKQSKFDNYLVSNYGRVKSVKRVYTPAKETRFFHKRTYPERIVKLHIDRNGYIFFRFSIDGKLHNYSIHRLVAEAFIPNTKCFDYINHKNENKSDNRVNNLEWCSAEYNSNYGTCQQRRSSSVKEMRRNRSISIDQYTINGDFIKHFSKKGEIDDAGFCLKSILKVCRHNQETSGGFVWRFSNEGFNKPEFIDSKGGTLHKEVIQLSLNGEIIKIHCSLLDAALSLGDKKKRTGICQCCNGKAHQAYGFIWKYKNK